MIGAPTKLTISSQCSDHFGPSYSTDIDTSTIQKFIEDLRVRQKSICECCEIIGHKANALITRGPNLLPPITRKKMNQFNDLHGDEPTDTPGYCNIQPLAYHFKYRTSPPKTSTVVSYITGRLNNHAIDNGDVEVHP